MNRIYSYSKQCVFVLLLCCFSLSCSKAPIDLVDYYRIYPQDEFGSGYYLTCKMGSKQNLKIENICKVKWSHRLILIEQDNNLWYLIKAKGDTLRCCNNDTVVGPIPYQSLKDKVNIEDLVGMKELVF